MGYQLSADFLGFLLLFPFPFSFTPPASSKTVRERSPYCSLPDRKYVLGRKECEKAEEEGKRGETASEQEEIVQTGRQKNLPGGRSWMHRIYY
jgi:hypothetical protein